jgi:hypothetical protein
MVVWAPAGKFDRRGQQEGAIGGRAILAAGDIHNMAPAIFLFLQNRSGFGYSTSACSDRLSHVVGGGLDQVAADEGLHEARCPVHQRAEVRCLDLPALGELPDHELGVGVNEEAVDRWGLARPCTLTWWRLLTVQTSAGPSDKKWITT